MTSVNIFESSDNEDDVDYVPIRAAIFSSDEEDGSDDSDLNIDYLTGKNVKTIKEENKAEIKLNLHAKIDEKQRASDLWKDFLNDVQSSAAPKNSYPFVCKSSDTTEIKTDSLVGTNKINEKPLGKEFEFAGETVIVCDKDLNSCSFTSKQKAPEKIHSKPISTGKQCLYLPKKRGIESVLGTIINKNKKLSIIDKTLIDWKMFKRDEGLNNDLKKFNKGKQGFIERQRFLERTELRAFEIEKSTRQSFLKK